jgi:CRP-like cAMP-binding protein
VTDGVRSGLGSIGRDSFWALLPAAEREALLRLGSRHQHPIGAVIVREGDRAGSVFVLLTGRAKVVSTSPRGNSAMLAVRGPGDIVGELSAVVGKRRVASVVTVDPVDVLRISGETFSRVLRERPAIMQAVLQVMSQRLHDDNSRRTLFADSTSARRLELLLAELVERHGIADGDGVQITLPFSQEDLAGSIDASREAVVRALRTLRDEGIVRTDRQRITVLRPDELKRRAESA